MNRLSPAMYHILALARGFTWMHNHNPEQRERTLWHPWLDRSPTQSTMYEHRYSPARYTIRLLLPCFVLVRNAACIIRANSTTPSLNPEARAASLSFASFVPNRAYTEIIIYAITQATPKTHCLCGRLQPSDSKSQSLLLSNWPRLAAPSHSFT
jgi:hypothetical protein